MRGLFQRSFFSCSSVAQSVEQATVNRWVAGSSPARGAKSLWPTTHLAEGNPLLRSMCQRLTHFMTRRLTSMRRPRLEAPIFANAFRPFGHSPVYISRNASLAGPANAVIGLAEAFKRTRHSTVDRLPARIIITVGGAPRTSAKLSKSLILSDNHKII